ncbi:hypothetical protein E2562_032434 [Oryza meyeriana var. granulata]|uniref:Uncharacterized protein n=1 Tax=Oryza meyeriana var. granulata TaxID=110450 RepID=A0A6G1E5Z5_9ORYZ|nr:hypothetical protein E2562_032434 [Oryza meyeriana var. granulata]
MAALLITARGGIQVASAQRLGNGRCRGVQSLCDGHRGPRQQDSGNGSAATGAGTPRQQALGDGGEAELRSRGGRWTAAKQGSAAAESPSTLQHTGSTINIAAHRKRHLHYQEKRDEEKGELTSSGSRGEGRRRIDASGALGRRPGDVKHGPAVVAQIDDLWSTTCGVNADRSLAVAAVVAQIDARAVRRWCSASSRCNKNKY